MGRVRGTRASAKAGGVLFAALLLVSAWPASAAPSPGEGKQSTLGTDVSWPPCGSNLPCLKEQLEWAATSSAMATQLNSLPSWVAGARTADGAKAKCADPPLTAGGEVTLTQFVSGKFDYMHSCS